MTVGLLVDPRSPNIASDTSDIFAGARTLGLQVVTIQATNDFDLDAAFAQIAQQHIDALIVSSAIFLTARRTKLSVLAAHSRVPVVYSQREFPEVGGLMSYGASGVAAAHLFGSFVGRVLSGANPADLPFEQGRKGAWPRSATQNPRHRRRGDRVGSFAAMYFCTLLTSRR